MKEQVLISDNDYKLLIKYDETNLDYYTDVLVEVIVNGERLPVFKDNLLELRNIVERKISDIHVLNTNLEEANLGILLNEYYLSLYEDKKKKNLVVDDSGEWIGIKYCISIGCKNAVWLYKYNGKTIFLVTPLFTEFESDKYIDQYNKFCLDYKDLLKKNVRTSDLIRAKINICKLCNDYINILK